MSSQIAGVLCAIAKPVDAPAAEGMGCLEFTGGFVRHSTSVDVYRTDSVLCASVGAPRFLDDRLRSAATVSGNAKAWSDAFLREGIAAPNLAFGRFAVVLIDLRTRRTLLATDRFATFPLCYETSVDRIAFSDRADTVPQGARRVSPQALYEYLYFHMIPAPRTVFDGVERVPAGHVAVWENGSTTRHAWWKPHFAPTPSMDLESAKQEFRRLVRDSVSRETAADTGSFLSGGTDSSTIAGMLGSVSGKPARTYSIGFEASGYDEMHYARIAARHFETDHHEYYVTPADLMAEIRDVAVSYDQPFGNSSAVAAFICARNARSDGVTRMLAGDGGDELFGGNARYAKQKVFALYEQFPCGVRSKLLEPLARSPARHLPLVRKLARYVEQARVPLPDRAQLDNLLLRMGIAHVCTPEFLRHIDQGTPLLAQQALWRGIDAGSLTDRMLAFDWRFTLADNDLPKVIGTSSLAGVDVAFPLLSDELVEFSARLPVQWKVKGMTLRWFFKEALRGFLPDEIIAKKKHGFGLPFGIWTVEHAGLNRLARESLEAFATRGVVRGEFVRQLLDQRLAEHPGYYGEMIWILVVLELWMQEHAPDWRMAA